MQTPMRARTEPTQQPGDATEGKQNCGALKEELRAHAGGATAMAVRGEAKQNRAAYLRGGCAAEENSSD